MLFRIWILCIVESVAHNSRLLGSPTVANRDWPDLPPSPGREIERQGAGSRGKRPESGQQTQITRYPAPLRAGSTPLRDETAARTATRAADRQNCRRGRKPAHVLGAPLDGCGPGAGSCAPRGCPDGRVLGAPTGGVRNPAHALTGRPGPGLFMPNLSLPANGSKLMPPSDRSYMHKNTGANMMRPASTYRFTSRHSTTHRSRNKRGSP